MKGTLEASTTTALVRNTVHEQYEGRALGVYVLNQLCPIILNVRQPGGSHKQVILLWGDKTQKWIPFSDLGWVDKNCIKVYTFNIRHYITCYLPSQVGSDSQPTLPYTYNLCQVCGAAISDDYGRLVHQIINRRYRANMYVYMPTEALQEDTGTGQLFDYQERAISCKPKTSNHTK